MIGALGALAIVFYALIYSGLRELAGYRISTLDALLGKKEVQVLERVGAPGTGGGSANVNLSSGVCNDRARKVSHPHGTMIVRLVPDAMRAFVQAERSAGRHIPLTGAFRSCATQTEKHDSDPARFTDPSSSAHPMGRAIDVASFAVSWARPHLIAAGWTQARPDDEPWHFSSGITA